MDKLMLEYHTHANYLVFQNEYSHLVTALPYIDEKLDDPSYKDKVSDMIRQEMKTMDRSKDYLEKLQLPKLNHLVRDALCSLTLVGV